MSIEVKFTVKESNLPKVYTEDQLEEWVNWCIGATSGISMDNPLHDIDMEAWSADIDT